MPVPTAWRGRALTAGRVAEATQGAAGPASLIHVSGVGRGPEPASRAESAPLLAKAAVLAGGAVPAVRKRAVSVLPRRATVAFVVLPAIGVLSNTAVSTFVVVDCCVCVGGGGGRGVQIQSQTHTRSWAAQSEVACERPWGGTGVPSGKHARASATKHDSPRHPAAAAIAHAWAGRARHRAMYAHGRKHSHVLESAAPQQPPHPCPHAHVPNMPHEWHRHSRSHRTAYWRVLQVHPASARVA